MKPETCNERREETAYEPGRRQCLRCGVGAAQEVAAAVLIAMALQKLVDHLMRQHLTVKP